jgi:cysteine-rich repeat protein
MRRSARRWIVPLPLLVTVGCPDSVPIGPDEVGDDVESTSTDSDSTDSDSTDSDFTDSDSTDSDSTDSDSTDSDSTDSDSTDSDSTDSDSTDSDSTDSGDPECGDGIVEGDEECDAGPENGPGQACNAQCLANVCGDGDPGPAEGCDDGNDIDDDGCTNACTLPNCGNGQLDLGEECDDGNDADEDACLSACVLASCGDSNLFAGVEACDDGPLNSDTAACTASCEAAVCGDGLVWADVEECDLGDDNAEWAACLDSCVDNVCGDGFWSPDIEQCDDGNLQDDDGCSSDCIEEFCGDGIQQGEEECDDGNASDVDDCTTLCLFPICGDSILHGGEQCDDWNDLGNDGCSTQCVAQAVLMIDAGAAHTCAVLDQGNLRCWGNGAFGRLGYANINNIGDNEIAAAGGDVNVGGGNIEHLSLGGAHTCVSFDSGEARCWGRNTNGQLGLGHVQTIGDNEVPAAVGTIDVGEAVVDISAGGSHTCALLDSGNVRCWGLNADGRLGYGHTNDIGDNEVPSTISTVAIGGAVVQLSAGDAHTCALLGSQAVRCWGDNTFGQLGYAHTNDIGDDETPASVGNVPVGGLVTQIAAGMQHTCAVMVSGAVRCWGRNTHGQLGYGNTNHVGDDETPASVGDVDVGIPVVEVATGYSTCAKGNNDFLRCWGLATYGQLGYGDDENIGDDEAPASVGQVIVGGWIDQFAAGEFHTCAVLTTNDVLLTSAMRCWGNAGQGRLGYGNAMPGNIGVNQLPAQVWFVPVFE